jgi:hypothetical protein
MKTSDLHGVSMLVLMEELQEKGALLISGV